MRRRLFLLASLAFAAPALVSAQTPPHFVRGTIEALQGDQLSVLSREGEHVRIHLAPNYTVSEVVPAQLSDIKPGVFIGTATLGPRDKMRAAEVLLFPEAMRGTSEGHFPWDLMPESTMTNATIEAESAGTDGRVLTLNAKGERYMVQVPETTPIVTFMPGTPAMLTQGAKVFIGTQRSEAGLTAARVAVGKDGLTPPM